MQRLETLPAIKIESFEGPFDLLLELARAHKINLADISLQTITNDFLEYLSNHKLPARTQADFLIVAATLLLLKIRHMLPSLTPEEEEEISELTDRVRIYNLYRKKAFAFIESWQKKPLLPAHFWASAPPAFAVDRPPFPDMTASNLQELFEGAVKKIPKPIQPKAHLTVQGRTLQEWFTIFSTRLSTVKNIVFQDAVRGATRQDTAVSFLALLEMARNKEIHISQDEKTNLVISKRS